MVVKGFRRANSTGFILDYQEMTAVLFLPAQMCLIAPKEGSVLTLMCASVRRIGLERTVPSSLVNHSTTAQVIFCTLCFHFLYLRTYFTSVNILKLCM